VSQRLLELRAVPALIATLKEVSEENVRCKALRLLGQMGGTDATEAIGGEIAEGRTHDIRYDGTCRLTDLGIAVVAALREIATDRARELLSTLPQES
jgi:hypothetical protein